MSRSSHVKVTIGEKLGVVLTLGVVMMKVAYVLMRYPFFTDPQAQRPLIREIDRTVARTLVTGLNPAQLHWLFPGSTAAYKRWIKTRARKEEAPAEVVTELIGDDGAKLHWIGDKDAKKVILHFHSGGFVMALNNGHLSLINYFRREIRRRSNVKVKAAFLEYTRAPKAIYPTQYQQAARAVQHILNSGNSPSDVLLSGDSAGGMLVLQIISQYLHPHPSISVLSLPPVPFAGFLAVSPWVTFNTSAPSFLKSERDSLSTDTTVIWAGLMLQGKVPPDGKEQPEEYWKEPLKAPQEWWEGTERVTRHVMIVNGEWECLRDDILALVEKFKTGAGVNKVDIVAAEDPMGVHIASFIDASRGRAPRDMAKIMANWIHDRLVV